MRINLALGALLCGLLLAASPALAGIIGLSSTYPAVLYGVDPATGAATPIVTVTGASGVSLTGLEILNGVLYATDVDTGELTFGSIDRVTGAYTVINNQAGSFNWHALAANPVAGLLYSVDINSSNYDLVSVTPAGAVTVVGPTNESIRGLAYGGGTLYGVTTDSLYTISTSSGAATLVGSLGQENWRPGLAYDADAAVLYLNLGDPVGALYTVNTATGLATLVGPNSALAVLNIDGLAWESDGGEGIPEPSAFVLFALGAGALLVRRKIARQD